MTLFRSLIRGITIKWCIFQSVAGHRDVSKRNNTSGRL